MPSSSAAQHRWIGWLHSHPEERPASLSKGQVDEWLHADKGSPWKHKDAGGALNDIPPDYARFVLGDGGLAGVGAHMLRNSSVQRPSQHFQGQNTFRPIPGYPHARPMTADDWDGGAPATSAGEDYKGYDYGGSVQNQYGLGSGPYGIASGSQGGIANGVADSSVIGSLTTPGGPSCGPAPSVTTQNPLYQQSYQRYAQLPVEKLQELAVQLPPNSAQGQMVRRALQMARMRASQYEGQQQQQQAQNPTGGQNPDSQGIASGQQQAQGGPVHRDGGGMLGVPLGEADPWWTRAAARQDMSTGYLHGSTFGRADHLTTQAPGGAYVVPADVVSGLGEGNSMAGANVIQRMLETGPYGTPLPRAVHGRGPPQGVRPPAPYQERGYGYATRGGHVGHDGVGKPVPVKFSHGEFVLTPQQVMRIARAHYGWRLPRDEAMKAAHELLDKWVVAKRKETAQKMLKLPGPTK